MFLDIRVVADINVVHHGGGAGDRVNFDKLVQSHLKVGDDRDQDGELDGSSAGGVDTHSHIRGGSLTGQRTQPFLMAEGLGEVGVGQLPAVIDQVVSQAEEDRAFPSGLEARLDLDSRDGVGGQGTPLGLNCFLAEKAADGFKM